MKQLGLLLLMIVLVITAWAVIAPVRHGSDSGSVRVGTASVRTTDDRERAANPARPVTFQEVSEKSRDALTTTAAYMTQEKDKLQVRMSDTLHKLDQEIERLQAAQDKAKNGHTARPEEQDSLNHRLLDLKGAKTSLLQMRAKLPVATRTAWNQFKTNWNRLEVDINAHLQSSGQPSEQKQ